MITSFDEPQSQIRAEYAMRLGRLFCDYEKRLTHRQVTEHQDAMFTITSLQSLLMTCAELMENMKKVGLFRHELSDIPSIWGLTKSMVKLNTLSKLLTHYQVVKRIGIVLCHPISGVIEGNYPTSGYSTVMEDGLITGFSFIHSPDVRVAGSQPIFGNLEKAEIYRNQILKEFERELNYKKELIRHEIPNIKVKREDKRRFLLVNDDGSPYIRIFRIDVPLNELKLMLRGVSNYLAQPVQNNWNGKDFKQFVQ